ncbi:MAG TPA: GNAT family N-acetyltransferase [Candidatus Fimadaptatus faecigallinarum]|uniref:GNAT family N-acetyltransferase n=1 Tax=Candidatus Fimadaptatus faecigallinarum TaxID=2840814 RepID=A0A9D1LR83_9FIRM|nr:GNAT family N-acetyltransferase [Candidatus Fimadaptatus faecigallinarum]
MSLEQLGADRFYEMDRLRSIAFTSALETVRPDIDLEAANQQELLRGRERWGMIDEQTGRLMGRMLLSDYQTRVGGRWLKLVGISSVATLPEYRRMGVMREAFRGVLPRMYRRGAALSGLYPFSHAFYRKFGYEAFGGQNDVSVGLEQLRAFPRPDAVRMIDSDADMLAARAIYERFAQTRDLAMRRELDYQWKREVMSGDPYKDLTYKYLMLRKTASGELEPCAYISFKPENRSPNTRIASAREAAYLDGDAFRRLLGFMSTFYPHYERLNMALPGDVRLGAICQDCYDVEDSIKHGYMLRAINAKLLLECQPVSPIMRLAAQAGPLSMSIALADEFIPQNTGRYELTLTPDGLECVQGRYASADIEADIPSFTQLVTGSLSLGQAGYRAGLRINVVSPLAQALFAGRDQYIGDHY